MYLKEICTYMGIPASNPQRFLFHRWLSVYDVAISTHRLLPAFKALYLGFMNKGDQELYRDVLKELYSVHRVSAKAQTKIQPFHQELSKKGKRLSHLSSLLNLFCLNYC